VEDGLGKRHEGILNREGWWVIDELQRGRKTTVDVCKTGMSVKPGTFPFSSALQTLYPTIAARVFARG
jgi:hypothetical protein